MPKYKSKEDTVAAKVCETQDCNCQIGREAFIRETSVRVLLELVGKNGKALDCYPQEAFDRSQRLADLLGLK